MERLHEFELMVLSGVVIRPTTGQMIAYLGSADPRHSGLALLNSQTGELEQRLPSEYWAKHGADNPIPRSRRLGFLSPLHGIAVSENGQAIACCFGPGHPGNYRGNQVTINVWDLSRKQLVMVLGADDWHSSIHSFTAIALNADGTRLAVGTVAGEVGWWDLTTEQLIASWHAHKAKPNTPGATDQVNAIAIFSSPDVTGRVTDQWLATAGGDGYVYVWDIASGKQVAALLHQGKVGYTDYEDGLASDVSWIDNVPVRAVRFRAAGQQLITGGDDCQVTVWDWQQQMPIQRLPLLASVKTVDLSSDQTWLVSSDQFGGLTRWDLQQGTVLQTIAKRGIQAAAIGLDGRMILLNSQRHLELWGEPHATPAASDSTRSTALRDRPQYPLHSQIPLPHMRRLAISPNSQLLAVMTGSFPHLPIHLCDLTTEQVIGELTGATHNSVGLAFHPHSTALVNASSDGNIQFWDLQSQRMIAQLRGQQQLTAMTIDSQWQVMATCDVKGGVQLYDLQVAQIRFSWQLDQPATDAAITADGRYLVVLNRQVQVWDLSTGLAYPRSFVPHWIGEHENFSTVAIHPQGEAIAVSSSTITVVWDFATANLIAALPTYVQYAGARATFSPDGQTLFTGCSSHSYATIAWDWRSGLVLRRWPDLTEYIACTPNGQFLMTAGANLERQPNGQIGRGNEGTIRLWQMPTSTEPTPSL